MDVFGVAALALWALVIVEAMTGNEMAKAFKQQEERWQEGKTTRKLNDELAAQILHFHTMEERLAEKCVLLDERIAAYETLESLRQQQLAKAANQPSSEVSDGSQS